MKKIACDRCGKIEDVFPKVKKSKIKSYGFFETPVYANRDNDPATPLIEKDFCEDCKELIIDEFREVFEP